MMQQFALAALVEQRQANDVPWLEFLRTESLTINHRLRRLHRFWK